MSIEEGPDFSFWAYVSCYSLLTTYDFLGKECQWVHMTLES